MYEGSGAMSWQFTYQACKGARVNRYFWSATIWDSGEPPLWWSGAANAFIDRTNPMWGLFGVSSHSRPIRTFRAFKRFLRKHRELQTEGRKVRLVNRFVGYDITAEWMP